MTTLAATLSPRRAQRRVALPVAMMALGTLAAAAAAFAGAAAPGHPSALVTTVHVFGGLTYVLVGGAAWLRRPNNRTGVLMTAAGLAWFVGDLAFAPWPVAAAIGQLFNIAWFGLIGHLVLAFPSGRLDTAADRVLVVVAYLWTLVGNALPEVFFARPSSSDVFALNRDVGQHDVAQATQQSLNIAVALAFVVVVALHYRRGTTPARRAIAPAFWASGPMVLAVIVLSIPSLGSAAPWLPGVLPVVTPIALASLPVTFVIGLLRSRLAVAAIGHLVVELDSSPPADHLRELLARTLHDPSVAILYHVRRRHGWVDSEGRSVSFPVAAPRAYTVLERNGQPVAALVHDRSLEDDPTLVAGVAAAASLAIDNARLQADLRARLAQVRESRARLVEVADAERRRLERDLHDGAQQRLIALSLSLGHIAERLDAGRAHEAREVVDTAESQLRAALAELRQLAAGIRPAVLTDAGLGAALEALAEQAPVAVTLRGHVEGRLPDAVEAAAYFVVCEALANAAKHAAATAVTVAAGVDAGHLVMDIEDDGVGGANLRSGGGLRGLADRVGALGGSIDVDSMDGGGTRIHVELPCA